MLSATPAKASTFTAWQPVCCITAEAAAKACSGDCS